MDRTLKYISRIWNKGKTGYDTYKSNKNNELDNSKRDAISIETLNEYTDQSNK